MKIKFFTLFLFLFFFVTSTSVLVARPSIGGIDQTLGSLTANAGMYANRIPSLTHNRPYTEICFKDGEVEFDLHSANESTEGGNCLPNDVGWVIEQDERSTQPWEEARAECLLSGMRLLEVFEWKYSCKNADAFNLNDMTGNWEWASNYTTPLTAGSSGPATAVLGRTSCTSGSWNWVADSRDIEATHNFRCAK